jgi:hypothetical protein
MAAPVTTTRGSPAGQKLKDGFSTKIAFASNPTIEFWEKTVQPAGMDGGEPIDQTTMHNIAWRFTRPRALKTLTVHTTKAAYDPDFIPDIFALINREDSVTDIFPDGSTLAFYGFLQKIEFDQNEEGKQPECTVTIVPTNYDYVNNVEAAPVFVPAAGT